MPVVLLRWLKAGEWSGSRGRYLDAVGHPKQPAEKQGVDRIGGKEKGTRS